MIVVSPLAEVIEEVRHRRLRCQRRHLVVNDEAPSGDYRRRSAGFVSRTSLLDDMLLRLDWFIIAFFMSAA